MFLASIGSSKTGLAWLSCFRGALGSGTLEELFSQCAGVGEKGCSPDCTARKPRHRQMRALLWICSARGWGRKEPWLRVCLCLDFLAVQ